MTAGQGQAAEGPAAEGQDVQGAADAGLPDIGFRILNWIGIIDQLAGSRANALLGPLDLTLPQFTLLNHFSWRGEDGLTVGGVAQAMQQPQPGITKTLQKLEQRGYLWSAANPADGRSHLLYLSEAGRAAHHQAVTVVSAALAVPFADWDQDELQRCFRLLDRLKIWFDANR